MSNLTIPFFGVNKQYNVLRKEILDVTDEVLRTGHVMSGNYTAEFENWLAKKNNVKFAITCHSGTQALETLARYYKQDINDAVVVMPALTFAATANAFITTGWDIEFVDTDHYGLIDYSQINYNRDITVVVGVGLYGAELPPPKWITTEHPTKQMAFSGGNKIFIEDAAQHWLSNNYIRSGQAAAISFDPTKNFANYGNGGAIVTNDSSLFWFAQEFRDNGKSGNYTNPGTNSRMSEVDCAQMMVKSRYLDSWQQRRKQIAEYWMKRFSEAGVRTLIDKKNFNTHCYHKFVLEVDNRDQLQEYLKSRRIETRVHYARPLHEIGVFRQYPGPDILCRASALSRRVLSLPIYPELTDLEVEYIIDQVLSFYEQEHS